ncbi:ABC-2 transporter permease [Cohnella faecalis]|uniref:Uncharacterized protein n=1 Tax=Cohnella faecalis TaxID=2315694 RepID=A0A398CJE4_9BACL|nr:ABC-2 transporter permease [Cohnella faecalis]RIE02252.1 hypothetical protein D3H35_16085 [Cohnella faecalis]
MSVWQAVKHLGRFQLKSDWLGFVLTLLFVLYSGGLISVTLNDVLTDPETPKNANGLIDWMYLCLFPAFGLLINKNSISVWRNNTYHKRLSHWRTMPIPAEAIVLSRWLQAAVMVPLNGLVYLFLQYAISSGLRAEATAIQWLENAIVWIGYGLVVNAFFIFLELGYDGKKFTVIYTSFFVVSAAAVAFLTWQDIHVVDTVLAQIQTGRVWLPILSVLLAAVAFREGFRLTLRRIKSRPFTF